MGAAVVIAALLNFGIFSLFLKKFCIYDSKFVFNFNFILKLYDF